MGSVKARSRRQRPGNGGTRRPALMKDVADRAGVSLMTVSRALRLPSQVAPDTLARVEAALAELNYVGSAFAGQLSTGRTRLVAVVLPDLRNPAFALALQGLSDALGNEYELIVASAHGGPQGETRVVRAVLGYRPAALVIHGGPHTRETKRLLAHSATPLVELGSLVSRPLNFSVGYSNRSAGRAATEHLLQRGYRRIGFVSQSRRNNSRAEERWRGYREALRDASIAPRPALELEMDLGYERGAEALSLLMQRDRKLDAVFFVSDGWALGALLHCQRHGIDVPGRVAILGFDDQEFSALTVPALSTIHVPRYEMGFEAGKLLVAQLAGKRIGRKRIDLGFRLVAREST